MTDVTNLLSSDKSDWQTPPWLFRFLDNFMHFDVDVCARKDNAKCTSYISKEEGFDCLVHDWRDFVSKTFNRTFFMNPPWGFRRTNGKRESLDNFVLRAIDYVYKGWRGALVLPAHVESKWFKLALECHLFCVVFMQGRVNYYVNGSEYYIPTKGKRKGLKTKTASTIGTILLLATDDYRFAPGSCASLSTADLRRTFRTR